MEVGVAVLSLMLALPACSSGPETIPVLIGAGDGAVALLDDVVVTARGGDTLEIRHAGAVLLDAEAPVTHAFVAAADDALPPLFTPLAGGLIPNPAIWGACRGGDLADAAGDCPLPPAEGPATWDGRGYWSTGALVPGDTREVALAEDIAEGEHRLTCALHPELAVIIDVGGDAQDPVAEPTDVAARVEAARSAVDQTGSSEQDVVTAGVEVAAPPSYVAGFFPQRMRIRVGDTVTWRAGARTPVDVVFGATGDEVLLSHTSPADARPAGNPKGWDGRGVLRSGFLSADGDAGAVAATWTVTFTRPGTYRYASRFADDMSGEVIVEEAP
jgi:plastocyanin